MKIYGPVRVDIWKKKKNIHKKGKIVVILGDEHYDKEGQCMDGTSVMQLFEHELQQKNVEIYIENLPYDMRQKLGIHHFGNNDWLGTISNWAVKHEHQYPITFIDVRYPDISHTIEIIEGSLRIAEIKIHHLSHVSNKTFFTAFGDVAQLLMNNYLFLQKKSNNGKCILSFIEKLPKSLKKLLLHKQKTFFELLKNNPIIHKKDYEYFGEEVYKAYSYYQDVYTIAKIISSTKRKHYVCVGWGHLDTLKEFLEKTGFHFVETYTPTHQKRCIDLNIPY